MNFIEHLHNRYIRPRRSSRLGDHFARLIPPNTRVLDVGCGDGFLAHLILQQRPDLEIKGIEVLHRSRTYIPIMQFAGEVIPYDDASFDVVMFSNVLHHTDDPMILLREAVRVARQAIVIKDHLCNGFLDDPMLRFMDRVSNAHRGIVLPYNYWPEQLWLETFDKLNLTISVWQKDLKLYPVFIDWIFGRSLHFMARLDVAKS